MHTISTIRYFITRGVLHIPAFNLHVSVPVDFNEAKLLTYLQ